MLDGMVEVAADGAVLAELGPGAMLGERASLEQGRRTATVRAVTDCRIVTYAAAAFPPRTCRSWPSAITGKTSKVSPRRRRRRPTRWRPGRPGAGWARGR